jgi:hypothetical protein
MTAYMKVAGDYPIAKIVIPLKKRTIIHPDFIDKTEDVIHVTHKTPVNVNAEEESEEKGPESTAEAAIIAPLAEAGNDSVVTPSEESEKPQADSLW